MILYAAAEEAGRRFYLRPTINLPYARGRVRLVAADPSVPPALDLCFFEDERDRIRMREGILIATRLVRSPDFRGIIDGWRDISDSPSDDEEGLDKWMLVHADTGHHLSGTCCMGLSSDRDAVVDAAGRVHGVERLRVVDASIIPTIIRANINACTMMIAEKISDDIRGVRTRKAAISSDYPAQ
jgi:choline dehydrogenase